MTLNIPLGERKDKDASKEPPKLERIIPRIDLHEEFQQKAKEMSENSKPLYELVVTEYFTVENVLGTLGKETLTVSPDNKDIPVKTIEFIGNSGVRAGEYIQAKIPRYEKRELEDIFEPRGSTFHSFYYPRDFRSQESAIELIILTTDGEILRTQRASNYDAFVKR